MDTFLPLKFYNFTCDWDLCKRNTFQFRYVIFIKVSSRKEKNYQGFSQATTYIPTHMKVKENIHHQHTYRKDQFSELYSNLWIYNSLVTVFFCISVLIYSTSLPSVHDGHLVHFLLPAICMFSKLNFIQFVGNLRFLKSWLVQILTNIQF